MWTGRTLRLLLQLVGRTGRIRPSSPRGRKFRRLTSRGCPRSQRQWRSPAQVRLSIGSINHLPPSSRRTKIPTDVEADGLEEPDVMAGRRKSLCWAKRLKRVFNKEVSICSACGCRMKIIASIEDSFVIGKILLHLEARCHTQESVNRRPRARAPPPEVW